MSDIYFFIQIRMASTRLPGKVLQPVTDNLTMVDVLHRRLQRSRIYSPDRTFFLTTHNPADDVLVEHFEKNNWNYLRGDEVNVFARFQAACRQLRPNFFFRICSDNPFLEPRFIDELGDYIQNNTENDYTSYAAPDGTPVIKTHYGFFAELVSAKTFDSLTASQLDRASTEHVTPIFYENPDRFKIKLLPMPDELVDDRIRLTVDTTADLELAKEIFVNLGPDADINTAYRFLKSAPHILERMKREKARHTK